MEKPEQIPKSTYQQLADNIAFCEGQLGEAQLKVRRLRSILMMLYDMKEGEVR